MTTRTTRRAKVAVAAAVGAIGLLGAGPAMAAGSVTVTPNPITTSSGVSTYNVNVAWTGFTPNKAIYISQCRIPQGPTLNWGNDCSALSEIVLNYSANATGSGNVSFPAFYGVEPSTEGGWGCYTATETPVPSDPWFNANDKGCYIRVVTDTEANQADAATTRVTFEQGVTTTTTAPATTAPPTTQPDPGTGVPEAPIAVLLPLAALVAAGGAAGFVMLQRRKHASA